MKALVCTAVLLLVAGSAAAQGAKSVTADIKNPQGQSVGTALLTPETKGVKIKLDIKNLPAGEHSIHIHQFAKCEAPDFKSAGPHFNGASGAMAEHSHDAAPMGDIPNFALVVGADGTAHVSVVAPNISLGNDDRSVFTNGGTSIVIHAVAGGTGTGAPPRIACGVISKP